ncbi:hypothetical protein V8E36_009056 [Tilletia maclaganii]
MRRQLFTTKYQQYKRDTAEISTFLARCALAYGFPISAFEQSAAPSNAADEGRTKQQVKTAKKNARRRAKKKAQTQADGAVLDGAEEQDEATATNGDKQPTKQTGPVQLPRGSFVIKSHQYLELAKFLVEKKAEIPIDLLQLIWRCINLRYTSLKRFIKAPDLSTLTHEHFINVLREVGSLLAQAREEALLQRIEKAGAKSGKERPDKSFVNQFEHLADFIEGEEDFGEEVPDIHLPAAPGPPKSSGSAVNVNFEPLESPEECINDVITFFTDLQDARDYIGELWSDWAIGKLDLMTCAIATNTALELLRKPHDELMARALPHAGGSIHKLLFIIVNSVRLERKGFSFDLLTLPLFSQLSDRDPNTQFIYDWFFLPQFQMLDGLARVIKQGHTPVCKPGYFGTFDATVDSWKLPVSKRWAQAQVLILEHFADYLAVVMSTGRESGQYNRGDEFARSMQDLVDNKSPNLLTMLCAQVFVDTVFNLRAGVSRGLQELQADARRMKASLQERRRVAPRPAPPSWAPENEIGVRRMEEQLAVYTETEDPITKVRRLCGLKGTEAESQMMRLNPFMCGLTLFRLRLNYQDLGLVLTNAWGTILTTAHLWHACREFGQLPGSSTSAATSLDWPNMSLILEMHGADDVFGGKTLTSIDDSHIGFLRMMGYSTDVLQAMRVVGTGATPPKKRAPRKKENPSGPKGLQDKTQIQPIFRGKYLGNEETGTYLDIATIEALASDMRARQDAQDRKAAG